MSSTPVISCSNGDDTVSAITWGFAPGYCAVTTMVGGATSGYSEIGNTSADTTPAISTSMESTPANTGRSMKKCVSLISASSSTSLRADSAGSLIRRRRHGCGSRHPRLLRRDLAAGARARQTTDDHVLACCEPAAYHAQTLTDGAKLDRAIFDRAIGADHEHIAPILVGGHGVIRYQNSRVVSAARQTHACHQPRDQASIRVVQYRPQMDSAGGGVHRVVYEVDAAGVRKSGFSLYSDLHPGRVMASTDGLLLKMQVSLLITVEGNIDRIERYDGSQGRFT